MTWRAVHPSLTEDRRVPTDDPTAPTFTLGFWPPIEAERAKIYVSRARRARPIDELEDAGEIVKRATTDLEAFRTMARFGVRGWSGLGALACSTVVVTTEGREQVVLSEEALDTLYHSGLLLAVALECWTFNNVTEAEKKTSSSPSNSSTSKSGMPVPAANRHFPPDIFEAASSVSMAAPSAAARTT